MFCQGCGKDLGVGANFCSYCGTKTGYAVPLGAPGAPGAPQRLYRSRLDRKVAGICGGLAQHASMDPTLMRVLWVAATFLTGGVPIIAYIILWIVVPEEPVLALPPGSPVAGSISANTQASSRA